MSTQSPNYAGELEVSPVAAHRPEGGRRITTILCLLVPALALAAGLRRVTVGWDDGAITAAFARTFAATGRIALTPSSEQVEGFSSVSWFLILAAGYKFVHSFTAMLAWTKIASAVCFSAALFSFRRIARHLLEPQYVLFAVLLLVFAVTPFTEVVNGMEMNLAMLLALLLIEVLYVPALGRAAQFGAAAVVSCLLLATRFEAPFLLFFLYLGLWYEAKQRGALAALVGVNLVEFGGMEIWRHKVFGLWLPNTILAKRWPPYTQRGWADLIGSRYAATTEIFTVLMMPILLLFALWVADRTISRATAVREPERRILPFVSPLTVGAFLLGLLLGQNWGHPGRMILPFLPFVVLAIVSLYRSFVVTNAPALRLLIPIVLVCHVCAWIALALNAAHENLTSARRVLPIGLAADRVRTMLGKQTLTAFIPDVGASALCCERLHIMDAGLLANRYLAQHGPGATAKFLAENRPDLIETHSPWEKIEHMHTQELARDYGLVRVNGEFLLLRRDLYTQLIARGAHEKPAMDSSGFCGEMPPPEQEDLLYFVGMQRCIDVPQSDAR